MSYRFDQSKFIRRAKEGVQKELASPDHVIVQVVAAIDELNKISNLASERLNEWYGLHFPEFRHKDPIKYAKVARILDRTRPDKEALEQLLPETYTAVLQKANTSVGVAFSAEDMDMLRAHADALLNLYSLKDNLEKYEESLALKICPNITKLAGAKIASQLVAHAGSLKKLAVMPSSTIQVLGAEKALFKHLKSGSPPPKHGLIFQHPQISMAPKHARGKIARTLAAKITIAAKADAFSHNDISETLKEQFEKRAAAILEKAKNAPPKKHFSRPQEGEGRRDFQNRRFGRHGSRDSGGRRFEGDSWRKNSQTGGRQGANAGPKRGGFEGNRKFFGRRHRHADR